MPGPFFNATPSIMTCKGFPRGNVFNGGTVSFLTAFTAGGFATAGGATGEGWDCCGSVGIVMVGGAGDDAPGRDAT